MTAHVHAANMALYAQDAAETDRPWERWEAKDPMFSVDLWRPVSGPQFGWHPEAKYRRKPRTIRIGEFDVPEPLREAPVYRAQVFYPRVDMTEHAGCFEWSGISCFVMLERGVCHLTREAAELHAKALISLSAKP